jgi:hypothetical protein
VGPGRNHVALGENVHLLLYRSPDPIEINTGISELSQFGAALGLDKPYRRIVRRSGPAGQVAKWLEQDAKDPFIAVVKTGFTTYDVLDEKGEKIEKQVNSFISDLKLSRVLETSIGEDDRTVTQTFIELYLLDDLGEFHRNSNRRIARR